MVTPVPRQLRNWGDEIGILVRRWWWVAALVMVISWLPPVPVVQVAFSVACLALLALIGVWVVVTARHMPRSPEEKWKRGVSRRIVSTWSNTAMSRGLFVRDHATGGTIIPAISEPVWDGMTCALRVALPQGLGREHLRAEADLLAQAFDARRAKVEGQSINALVLRLEYGDALEQPFTLDFPVAWDGKSIPMGMDASGALWSIRLGAHTLVAGASGSGKASLVWGLLFGLAEPIHAGLVEVWGIDRKGGMELAFGQSLLTRFAADAERSVILLEEAVEAMQQRARDLAGKTRQHVASLDSPSIVVLIDELAALTAYEKDRERWNALVKPGDVVLHLGDLALGPIEESIALTAQLNGVRLLVPGNHDRVSPATQSNRAVERFRPIYEEAGWTILPEFLDGTRRGTRLFASHYPYAGDTSGVERHSSHRPVDTGIPLLHGHTHERDFGPHGSHEFHVGVDAFDFAPIQFELIDAWLEDLRREEEEIAAIVRERTAAGESTSLDDLVRRFGVEIDGPSEQ